MNRIAIVGVEGSGKTVLLSAIGDKYENPDAAGVFMSPENPKAFGFVKLNISALRGGSWPAATTTNSNLDWSLFYKHESGKEKICSLSLLDFAGELYRLTFGEHTEEECAGYAEEIESLKSHISDSNLLIVIVNLSDVINASATNRRTQETMWLTKSVIDYATRSGNPKEVAIVFSQADVYGDVIKECGGTAQTLQKYMPHVANVYDDIPLFAVSAINATVPGENGLPVPAPNFCSEGVDELMEWIVAKTPGYASLADTMREKRLAPITLLNTIRELQQRYTSDSCADTPQRLEIARELNATLEKLRQANRKSPQYAQAEVSLPDMEQEAGEWLDFEQKAMEVLKHVTADDVSHAESMLRYALDNEPGFPEHEEELREEILRTQRALQAGRRKRRGKGVLYTFLSLLMFVLLLGAGYAAYLMKYIPQKEAEGYVTQTLYGLKYPVWLADQPHPQTRGILSAAEEKQWNLQVPYRWEGCSYEDRAPRSTALDTVWEGNIPHPTYANVLSTAEEGQWTPVAGYDWQDDTRTNVVWVPGKRHPENENLLADANEQQWVCDKPGYVWKSGTDIAWQSGLIHPQNEHLKSTEEQDKWEGLPGYVWEGEAKATWKEGLQADAYPHWVTTSQEGEWKAMDGYKKADPNAPQLSALVWDSTWNNGSKRATATEGNWEYRVTCDKCDGQKNIQRTKSCSKCSGEGKKYTKKKCRSCKGSGKTYSSTKCGTCNGAGVLRDYVTCSSCGGNHTQRCTAVNAFGNRAIFTPAGQHAFVCVACAGVGRIGYMVCLTCGGRGGFICNNCRGSGVIHCRRCSDGRRLRESTCSSCGGKGRLSHSSVCSSCSGSGTHTDSKDCSNCSGGIITYYEDCTRCNKEGYIWK